MALDTEQKLIGNNTYHVTQLGSTEARKLLVRLTKALAPILGAMMAADTPKAPPSFNLAARVKAAHGVEEGEVIPPPPSDDVMAPTVPWSGGIPTSFQGLMEVDSKAIGAVLQSLAVHLTEADLEHVVATLGKVSHVEKEPGKLLQLTKEKMELHFRGGHLREMFQWLGFALQVQYRDFFPVPPPGGNPDAEEKDMQT